MLILAEKVGRDAPRAAAAGQVRPDLSDNVGQQRGLRQQAVRRDRRSEGKCLQQALVCHSVGHGMWVKTILVLKRKVYALQVGVGFVLQCLAKARGHTFIYLLGQVM